MWDSVAYGFAGGLLIGLGAFVAMASTAKVPGISGIFGRLLQPSTKDRGWRMVFLLGMLGGAALVLSLSEFAAIHRVPEGRSLGGLMVAGLLVGFGTRYGGGCTSGHGVCGISLGVRDSIVATLVFMLSGVVTVALFKWVIS